jgi:Ca2+-binding EF-hand superfamily protein
MVSSVSSNAALSSAALSGSQCRSTRDPQALQEKLFSKLDVNGDGSIDQSELGQFVDFASSSTQSTSSASDSAGADLFKAMDTDGDGKLSKTELADGTKKLFDELRTQLMSASGGASSAGTASAGTTSATGPAADASQAIAAQASAQAGATQSAPSSGGHHHHHGGGGSGGMFGKIAQLIDQYRSNATTDDSPSATADASTLSVAA